MMRILTSNTRSVIVRLTYQTQFNLGFVVLTLFPGVSFVYRFLSSLLWRPKNADPDTVWVVSCLHTRSVTRCTTKVCKLTPLNPFNLKDINMYSVLKFSFVKVLDFSSYWDSTLYWMSFVNSDSKINLLYCLNIFTFVKLII